MRFFLTGATGFLGRHILKILLDQKHKVTILTREKSNLKCIEPLLPEINVVEANQTDVDEMFKLNQFDAVIHTLTNYGRGQDVSEALRSNTFFSLQLLESACKYGVPLWFNTDTFLSKTVNPYALSKAQFLEWGKYLSGLEKIRFVNVKIEYILGMCDDMNRLHMYVLEKCLDNVSEIKLTQGQQKRDFIDIRDVIKAYNMLVNIDWNDAPFFQEFEIGTGVSTSVCDFVKLIHRLTGTKTRLNFGALPYRPNEAMDVKVDLAKMRSLSWTPGITLDESVLDLIKCGKEQRCDI